MNKIVLLCIVMTISCGPNKILKKHPTIVEASVFSSFHPAGSTGSLRITYSELKEKERVKHKLSAEHLLKLNDILKKIKPKRHIQQKIAGIEKYS